MWLTWLRRQISSLKAINTANAKVMARTGQNLTGALVADTIYRIKFTNTAGDLMTYPAASYILVAVDPITGQQYGGIQELIPSDTTGEYTPVNAFRLQVAEDIPDGLIIRHFGK
jgi:hypothetical protein